MAVVIRLQRIGKHKQPYYRVVATDSRKAAVKKPIEILGSYNPRAPKAAEKVAVDQSRVDYWLSVGAQPSETVRTLLKASTSKDAGAEGKSHKKSKKEKARIEAAKAEKAEGAKAEAPKAEAAKA